MSDKYSPLAKSIAIIPKVGGTLSLIASSLIIRDVIIKWTTKRSVSLPTLLIFCITVADWLFSFFAAILSTWMTPVDTKKVADDEVITYSAYLARGNTQTCIAQGFIYILSLRAWSSYYAALMILYWLIVHYGWKVSRLNNPRLRSLFVLTPIIISLGLAIPPIFLGMYNYPGRFICAICDYPYGCTKSAGVDCERGEGGVTYSNYSHGYTVLCAVIMVTFVGMLVYEIYVQERKMARLNSGQIRSVTTTKTAWRGIQYIGVYLLSYFPSFVSLGYRARGNLEIPDAINYLFVILLPLLGFFNAIVYFRPSYKTYKGSNPDASWIDCLSNIFIIDFDLFGRTKAIGDVPNTGTFSFQHNVIVREKNGVIPSQSVREFDDDFTQNERLG